MTETERPDLECLERVEVRVAPAAFSVVAFLVACGACGLLLWPFIVYWEYVGTFGPLSCVLAGIAVLGLLVRELLYLHTYRTDRDGIEMRGPLRRLYLHWGEVISACRKPEDWWTSRYPLILETARDNFRISPYPLQTEETNGAVLVASVWQHLRRYGKQENIALPSAALSLWEPVPEDVPDTLEWQRIPSARRKSLWVIVIVGFVALAAVTTRPSMNADSWTIFAFVVVLYSLPAFFVLLEARRTAKRVVVTPNGIEAESANWKGTVAWRDLTVVRPYGYGLIIKFGRPQQVLHIVCDLDDLTGENAVLACIRHVRANRPDFALPLPFAGRSARTASYAGKAKQSGKAYLRTLEPEARKRIQSLDTKVQLGAVGAFLGTMVLGMLDVPAKLCRWVFSNQETIAFSTSCSGLVIAALALPSMLVLLLLLQPVAARQAGQYRAEWDEFTKRSIIPRALAKRIVAGLSVSAAVVAIIAFFCYARVTTSGVDVARPFRVRANHYSWQRIISLAAADKSQGNNQYTRYTVSFDDCTSWSASTRSEMDNGTQLETAIRAIIQHTGKAITYK